MAFGNPRTCKDLISACLKPLALADQISIVGPPVILNTKTAVTLALALHELATNAVKYGALSVPEGRVEIDWSVSTTRAFKLSWTEHGGPLVKVPSHQGFGTKMIERGLATEFEGSVKMSFEPSGLVCALSAILPGKRP